MKIADLMIKRFENLKMKITNEIATFKALNFQYFTPL